MRFWITTSLLFVLVAGLAAVCLWLVRRMQRRQRHKREGRCEGCGYDLNGLAQKVTCPECGKRRHRITRHWIGRY